MKVCVYCGSTVNDDMIVCPSCSATKFKYKCPQCGSETEGSFCPNCAARQQAEREQAQEARVWDEAVEKANTGLGWKVALTFFLPFIGGYALINDKVKTGYRVFGIVWCALIGASVSITEGGTVGGNILGSLLCFAPIGVYLFRTREKLLAADNKMGKVWLAAAAVLLVFTVLGDIAAADRVAEEAAESAPVTKTSTNETAQGQAAVPETVDDSSGASSAEETA